MESAGTNEFSELRRSAGLSVSEAADQLDLPISSVEMLENGKARPEARYLNALKGIGIVSARKSARSSHQSFDFIDLFAGIGGLRLAFNAIGGKCVFTSEWDKYCRQTYSKNFGCPEREIAGDIREVSVCDIPRHDVLVAGFPCQPFSIAGVSKKNALGRPHGFLCDTQGTLFFNIADIIAKHKPAAFLLENVKNLQRHDKGNTFRVIIRTLEEELGYSIDFRVINSQGWVPQRRERIFIVGFRRDTGFAFDDLKVPDPMLGPKLGAILQPPSEILPKYTLTPRLWDYLQEYKKKHQAKGNGFGCSVFGKNDVARTLSARYYKDGSEVLIKQSGKRPRRLTPIECSRLMGFRHLDGTDFDIPVSDTQAYKQFGNAVVVPAATAVARHMNQFILEVMSDQPPQRALPLEATLA